MVAVADGAIAGLNQLVPGFGDWAYSVIETIVTTFQGGVATITAPFAAIGQFFSDLWIGIQTTLGAFFAWWVQFWTDLFAPVWAVLEPVVAAMAQIWQSMVDTISTIWNGIATIISGVWSVVSAIITLGLQTISFLWNAAWGAISSFFTTIWNGIIAFLSPIISQISRIIKPVIDGIAAWWRGVWNGISSFFSGIWNGIASFISGAVSRVSGPIKSAFNGLNTWWRNLWDGIGDFFANIWGGIEDVARGAINGIIDAINGMLGPIRDVANALSSLSGGAINVDIPNLPRTAVGGVFSGAQARLIAEAGPEAVVPLNRPLSLVDPSVRGLSAIAQGLAAPGVAGGGNVVEAGAIVIQGSMDPAATAQETVNRLAERIGAK
jgi:phage-related protein